MPNAPLISLDSGYFYQLSTREKLSYIRIYKITEQCVCNKNTNQWEWVTVNKQRRLTEHQKYNEIRIEKHHTRDHQDSYIKYQFKWIWNIVTPEPPPGKTLPSPPNPRHFPTRDTYLFETPDDIRKNIFSQDALEIANNILTSNGECNSETKGNTRIRFESFTTPVDFNWQNQETFWHNPNIKLEDIASKYY